MKNFDWEDFRHFAALARNLHLGFAAKALQTSQVTVMRRVKALEGVLGVTLFVRRRDGHRLTVAGKELYALANRVEMTFDGVAGVIGNADKGNKGHARIATTEIGANWLLLPHIGEFRKDYPDINLEIDTGPNALDLLEDSETLALRFRRPDEGAHLAKLLGKMEFAAYANAKLARSIHATSGDIDRAGLPYVGWAGPFSSIGLSRWLTEVFDGQSPSLSLTTLQGQIIAGQQGAGVVGLPKVVGRSIQELVEAPVNTKPFSLEIWLVIPAQVRKISRISAVARFVESAVKRSIKF
jgi:DNA-binding transcriptional LysR family regulator